MSDLIVGVDLGGTNVESAVVHDGEILGSKKKKTKAERGVEVVLDRIAETVTKALDRSDATLSDVEAVCIGAPGAVDPSTGVVRAAPNLNWTDVALGDALSARLDDVRVMVDNDVNVGLMGEYAHGAAQNASDVVGIWVGTGVGGSVIVNDNLVYGGRGAAGEVGHVVVQPRGRRCGCGRRGCVEAYASKTGMEAIIREEMERGRSTVVFDVMEDKGKNKLTSSVIEGSLDAGDALMEEAIQTAQYYLGLLTADVVNMLDPSVIIFGGGVVERLEEAFVDPIARTARQHYLQRSGAEDIRIVPSVLGDDAGPLGAAVIATKRLAAE